MKTIGFIGSGKMAEALMRSIKQHKLARLIGSDHHKNRLTYLRKELGIKTTVDNKEVVNKSDVVFLSVKPQHMAEVLDEIKKVVKNQVVVSIAAGITLKKIEGKLKGKKVIRVMPNTPCLVGEMAAGYSLGKHVSKKDVALVVKILNSSGLAFKVKEKDLDAVTGLSGSGPAFFAAFIDGFYQAGKKDGLQDEVAFKLACQTAIGTGKLLLEKNMKPADLISMVSSPGGTTVAGMKVLKKGKVDALIKKVYAAAVKRSKELGKDA